MKQSSLSSSLIILEKDYSNATQNEADLDERIFVNDEDSLAGSDSLSGGAMNISGAKRKFDAMSSPSKTIKSPLSPPRTPSSPANNNLHGVSSNMVHTPVTTAMTTSKWLRMVISPLSSKPSADLEHYLLSCDKAIVNDVAHRAQIILEAIFPSRVLGQKYPPGSLQSTYPMYMIWAEKRRMEALKLYYRVMEAMCKAEAQRLQANNLTLLLVNERFHRCMLACSAELVLATHKAATLLFPTILDRTGITAFDLSKVIESFIIHEESLPRELRRHLSYLEERLLESMVWEKGSSLYNSLIVARPALSSEINHLKLLAEPMLSLDEIAKQSSISCGGPQLLPLSMASPGVNLGARSPKRSLGDNRIMAERNSFTSPAKDGLLSPQNLKLKLWTPPLQSSFSSPSRPIPGGGETCAETVINVFFGKVVKLAAARINGIVEKLQLSKHISESVFCLVQQILTRRTALFFNRHIDQIILCSLYGVCKISDIDVTFREIIYNYRKQTHCKPQVFRSVFVEWSSTRHNGKTGQEHVGIRTFYNKFFIPSIKPLLVEIGHAASTSKSHQVGNNTDAQCSNSPKLAPLPTLPDVSPKKVSKTHNIYVSPLKSSKMDGLMMSHNSKSYYACVGESTHAYQSPSKDLAAINNRLNNGKKVNGRLNFDDVGLVSDSQVMDSLSLRNANAKGSTSERSSFSSVTTAAKLPEKSDKNDL